MATIGDLPEEVLLRIFRHLSLTQRHRALAMVCRRWWQLVNSPELLQDVCLTLFYDSPRCLDSLCCWMLQRVAGHIRQLQISTGLFGDDEEDGHGGSADAGFLLMLGAMLSALGPTLTDLGLVLYNGTLGIGGWVEMLPGLQQLDVAVPDDNTLLVASTFSRHTALQRLYLTAGRVVLAAGAGLPPSLTSLALHGVHGALPPQVAELRHLRYLHVEINFNSEEDSGLSVIAQLSSLEQLEVACTTSEPLASLPLPPSVEALRIQSAPWSVAAADELLQPLTQLTCLALGRFSSLESLPPALLGLTRLQRFGWGSIHASATSMAPDGPWLRSLRWLALHAGTVARSQARLAAASQLEILALSDFQKLDVDAQAGLLRWLAQALPSLQRLGMGIARSSLRDRPLHPATAAACAELQRRRPALCIDWRVPEYNDVWEPVV